MSALSQEKAISALKKLGSWFREPSDVLGNAAETAKLQNGWFTKENVEKAFYGLGTMMNDSDLDSWNDGIKFSKEPKRIGLVLAGNIPLVGFHDVICVIATGNIALIKLSSSDETLIQLALSQLVYLEPEFANHIEYVERLVDFDAVIATGSNNSSRYFDYYFGKVPNIIRKNRNSVAVISGNESSEDFNNLGADIFDYYGLGCRNVSKVFVPEQYDFKPLFEGIEPYNPIKNHFKYNNNYDYNKAIYLVNLEDHLDNGFLLIKENKLNTSPLGVLYYENYNSITELEERLENDKDSLQCIVSTVKLKQKTFSFGESQQPKLWDYADDVDTVAFLNGLN